MSKASRKRRKQKRDRAKQAKKAAKKALYESYAAQGRTKGSKRQKMKKASGIILSRLHRKPNRNRRHQPATISLKVFDRLLRLGKLKRVNQTVNV